MRFRSAWTVQSDDTHVYTDSGMFEICSVQKDTLTCIRVKTSPYVPTSGLTFEKLGCYTFAGLGASKVVINKKDVRGKMIMVPQKNGESIVVKASKDMLAEAW